MNSSIQSPLAILLVEDSRSDADLVIETLEDASAVVNAPGPRFELARADRLSAAIDHVARSSTDAILLDLSLPDSQGLATFRRLHEQAPNVPIVVLSGLADEVTAAQAVREGAQDYLVKGEADYRLLPRTLWYAIERRRAEAERSELLRREQEASARAEAAEALVRQRDAFLTVAAHELKTPLTGLLSGLQLLLRKIERRGAIEVPDFADRLRNAEWQASKLGRLITQLLDISRIEAEELPLAVEEIDLAKLADGVVDLVQSQTERHRLVVRAESRPKVSADPARIQQVLTSLLDNALKFSPEGGDIAVEVSTTPNGTARLAVRDHGIGIPAGARQEIFQPFYQGHTRDHRSGLGLGLYISRRWAERHQGTISAEFPPDGGTRIIVELPLEGAHVE